MKKLLAMRCLGSVGALLEFWELALMLGELQGVLVGFWGWDCHEKVDLMQLESLRVRIRSEDANQETHAAVPR